MTPVSVSCQNRPDTHPNRFTLDSGIDTIDALVFTKTASTLDHRPLGNYPVRNAGRTGWRSKSGKKHLMVSRMCPHVLIVGSGVRRRFDFDVGQPVTHAHPKFVLKEPAGIHIPDLTFDVARRFAVFSRT